MEPEEYRRRFVVDPPPPPRFELGGLGGVALFFPDFAAAEAYYTEVLGPPGYVEGAGTRSWRVGDAWLTILDGAAYRALLPSAEPGPPRGAEVVIRAASAAEAERLQRAFVDAGGQGEEPSDQLMHARVRYCPVVDPFGTSLLVIAELER